ncbi:NAD(P)-binding protein [Calocera viscosa TUFC12733]|uniref:NAD(P)-binding protein n=1 Tax=Calocera viscosa (strain TUFC12733) TaxID=1330018 RepID=A0A167JUW7_CALVF|nr:NAD(P)-binding protein [Calocera viscosa TUFC12733]
MAPLPPGSLIVIVGITGYVGSNVGLLALKAGYRVRGTIRSMAKAEELLAVYKREGVDVSADKLQFVTLDDLYSQSKFETVFASADGVIHPALPTPSGPGDWVENIIESTLIPLRAASKAGIKRFVLTATLGTVLMPGSPDIPTDRLINEKDWNDAAVQKYINATEEEKKSPAFFRYRYVAGKTLAERAAWKYVETESPPFELTVIIPPMNWGPKLYGSWAISLDWLDKLLKGDETCFSMPPCTSSFHARIFRGTNQMVHVVYIVDIRDDAKLHVLALSEAEAGGKRILAVGNPHGWNEVLAILRKHFPNQPIPVDRPASPLDPCPWRADDSLPKKLLGGSWISLEQMIVDSAKSLGYD